jgi:hypothetical protein
MRTLIKSRRCSKVGVLVVQPTASPDSRPGMDVNGRDQAAVPSSLVGCFRGVFGASSNTLLLFLAHWMARDIRGSWPQEREHGAPDFEGKPFGEAVLGMKQDSQWIFHFVDSLRSLSLLERVYTIQKGFFYARGV